MLGKDNLALSPVKEEFHQQQDIDDGNGTNTSRVSSSSTTIEHHTINIEVNDNDHEVNFAKKNFF